MKKITILTTNDLQHHITEEHLLILELKRRGHDVKLCPWEDLTDQGEDLFLIRTTWNYTKHLSSFLKKLESIKDRLLNPLELVKWNSNKKYLIDLANRGHNIMPLELAWDQETLNEAIKKLGGEEFIVKPLVSASAIGLRRFLKTDLPIIKEEMIVQKFYPSIIKGENSLFFFNGKFSYAVKKIPKEGDIRVQEEYGSKIVPYKPDAQELESARNIVLDIPTEWLYARVDLVPGIGLIELECIEPSLYFSKVKESVVLFADAICDHF